jgi:serine/threonine protein phosphatase PrpC
MEYAFKQVHSDLGKLNFDTQLSGSTCVAILFDRNTIYSANAGDSRGVLYSYDRAQSGIKITPLSEDHKPCMPVEKKRVLSVGGRVDTIKGSLGQNLGPMRVWLMEQDAPGLAMSRSLGDYIAHSVGVSADPEVMRFELQPEDKFIIIASDGVWEFLSNEMIAKIVWPFYLKNSPEQAGNAIVRAAATKWRENDTVIDDITCVTIFLEVDH